MSTSTQSLQTLASSIKVKDVISVSINAEFLEMNFDLIKQCLTRVHELQKRVDNNNSSSKDIYERLNYIQKDIETNKSAIDVHEKKIKDIQQNLGEDFLRKFEELEEKTRNTHDIDKLAKQLEALNRFMTNENFKDFEAKNNEDLDNVKKIRDQMNKYVENGAFDGFKDQTSLLFKETNDNIEGVKSGVNKLGQQIDGIDKKATKASEDAEQNNTMMKEINFNDMQQKLRKFKEDSDTKISEMLIKLKKKVGGAELVEVQKRIVEQLDKFLLAGEKAKADRDQTKEALSFLEKRINELYEIFSATQEQEETDPLFATKKWMCASCSKDLGKFQGKLGQFKPWSVFPCREMDPEKTGGYGYLNYVDKMAYKKGFTTDDSGLERLNKTFYERNNDSPKKMNTTRATNFMSNYGTSEKNTTSLKDEYFKPGTADKGSKFFRVKKQVRNINDGEKQKVKEV